MSNEIETENRVNTCVGYLLGGRSRSEILTLTTAWGVTSRQIDNYLKSAKDKITEMPLDRSYELNKALARLESLFTLAFDNGNIREATNVINAQIKLLKLEPEASDNISLVRLPIYLVDTTVDDENIEL